MAYVARRGQRWRVQVSTSGGVRSATFDTRKEAREWGISVEDMDRRKLLSGTEAERTTLGEALDRYLHEITPLKKSADTETYRIGRWQRDPLASRSLASIRSTDIAKWRDAEIERGASPSSIKNQLQVVSHCYRVARTEWDMEVANPVKGVRMPKARKGRDRRLMPGEYERLAVACEADPNPWMLSVMDLAIETAMRLSEILGAERGNIENSVLSLNDTKNGTSRDVPLSTKARTVIETLPVSLDGRLVPANKHTIEHAWVRVCQRAEIEDLRIHDLRHEATSRLFEKGLDMMQVASIKGHKSLAMLKRYTHLKASDLVRLLG